MTLSEFIHHVDLHENDEKWYYFDYKHMNLWFKTKEEIMSSLKWDIFGINKGADESTIWIGSKGAHTNCHQDSYGCNLVAQIHGRKQWLLFPPSATNSLQPVRVPYEESTVYSKYNFFCTTKEDETALLDMEDMPRIITLEPGDVLFVPPGWWHYVESLNTSVSVNIWLPKTEDNIARVKEAIVKLIVAGIGKSIFEKSPDAEFTLSDCYEFLDVAIRGCGHIKYKELALKKMEQTTPTAKDLAAEYPDDVKELYKFDNIQFEKLLRMKRERFPEDLLKNSSSTNYYSSLQRLPEKLVNALCHPEIINKITESFLP